mgnify:CR=1 FL=1
MMYYNELASKLIQNLITKGNYKTVLKIFDVFSKSLFILRKCQMGR